MDEGKGCWESDGGGDLSVGINRVLSDTQRHPRLVLLSAPAAPVGAAPTPGLPVEGGASSEASRTAFASGSFRISCPNSGVARSRFGDQWSSRCRNANDRPVEASARRSSSRHRSSSRSDIPSTSWCFRRWSRWCCASRAAASPGDRRSSHAGSSRIVRWYCGSPSRFGSRWTRCRERGKWQTHSGSPFYSAVAATGRATGRTDFSSRPSRSSSLSSVCYCLWFTRAGPHLPAPGRPSRARYRCIASRDYVRSFSFGRTFLRLISGLYHAVHREGSEVGTSRGRRRFPSQSRSFSSRSRSTSSTRLHPLARRAARRSTHRSWSGNGRSGSRRCQSLCDPTFRADFRTCSRNIVSRPSPSRLIRRRSRGLITGVLWTLPVYSPP